MKKVDYTQFGDGKPPENYNINERRWWLIEDPDMRNQAILGVIKRLQEYDSKRQTQMQMSARLYGNSNIMGVNGLSYSKVSSNQNTLKDRLSYNLIQSLVDTLVTKVSQNKPKPMVLTAGGNWELQDRSKKLQKYVEGVFYQNRAYELGPEIVRDASVLADGYIHVFSRNGKVVFERNSASEILVDYIESYFGEPRQIHKVQNVDREVLAERFPEKREMIMKVNQAETDLTGQYMNIADQVAVYESYHLPSNEGATDGMHTIGIENGPLQTLPWKRQNFPFARYAWCKRLWGYHSQSLTEQVQNIQLEINKLLWVMQRSFHLAGSFKVFIKNGSEIVAEHVNNDIGAIVKYTDTPPQYYVPPVVPVEYYQHLERLIRLGYEQIGMSQLQASAVKPAGLNSGKALREYNDLQTDRFNLIGQYYENLFLDLARLTIEESKEMFESGEIKKLSVMYPHKSYIETIDWKDVQMEEDSYFMQMFPVSSLPDEPAGRLETIQEYVQAGFMQPRTGRKLLDFPDLDAVEDKANAMEDRINKLLDGIMLKGEKNQPDTFMEPSLALDIGLQYINYAKLHNVPKERVDQLEAWNTICNTFIQRAQAAAQAQQLQQAQAAAQIQAQAKGGGTVRPQAAPLPQPTSPLVQNVPGAA